ncbi:MAG TPA: hypothetical protein VGK74_26620 [Symbiobacteriaceae bacterium]|jgi:Rieske Fe-S protein
MRMWLRWTVGAVVAVFAGMVAFSVLASKNPATTERLTVPVSDRPGILFYRLPPDLDLPVTGWGPPTALVLTYDGTSWRAFSNRTAPFGCMLRPGNEPNTILEPCHGATWDPTGRLIAGPPRGIYAYPVRSAGSGRQEVDLSQPRLVEAWPPGFALPSRLMSLTGSP